jgi:hypothetical protein
MSPSRTRRPGSHGAWLAASLLFAIGLPLSAQQAGTIVGVVVDAESGEPVSGVEVSVADPSQMTVTDDAGGFQLYDVPGGDRRLILSHIAYGEHERSIILEEGGALEFEVRMSREAIELSPLTVEVRSEAERARLASGNSIDLVERTTIDLFERQGGNLVNLLGREVPGMRINGSCVEFRLGANSRTNPAIDPLNREDPTNYVNSTCREPAIFLDGVRANIGLKDVSLDQLESVEVLSPSEASIPYGSTGAFGVLLLETRTGMAPEASTERVRITGFAWPEPQPYRWPKVLGVSLATHAVMTALTFGTFIHCTELDTGFGTRSDGCSSALATGAGVVTGIVGGLLTTWAGESSFTEGRNFPVMAVGAASATASYLLVVHGQKTQSDFGQTAGIALATAGTTLLTTLADRVFRVVR